MKFTICLVVLLPLLAYAQSGRISLDPDTSNVPTILFDVELGGIYELPEIEDAPGTFPVSKLKSLESFLGTGTGIYFQPLSENAAFPYREWLDEGDEHPRTTYRLYALPMIPEDTDSLDSLQSLDVSWRVMLIEWVTYNDLEDDGPANYSWANDLCRSIEVDLEIEPEITNFYDNNWYSCVFTHEERELEVTSGIGQRIRLGYVDEIADKMNNDVEAQLRKLQMEEIRPFPAPESLPE